MSEKPAHRVYRGTASRDDGSDARILVMDGGPGPTERERASVLYHLTPEEPFWWGYGGGSPSRTAAAILEDVEADVPSLATMPGSVRGELTAEFTRDFLAYAHDERGFWLPARTVVRWIHGYVREQQAGS